MHLVPMDRLANFIGVSRQAVANMVTLEAASRSLPKTGTVIKLAEAFNVPLNSLYQDPLTCLQYAVDGFEDAPIRAVAPVPEAVIERVSARLAAVKEAGVDIDLSPILDAPKKKSKKGG